MNIQLTFKNVKSSDAVKEFVDEKFQRLQRYFNKPLEVNLVLSLENYFNVVDATIVSKNLNLKAKEKHADMYSAIDLILDNIEGQLRRHKEKVKHHKHKSLGSTREFSDLIAHEDSPSQITFKTNGDSDEPLVLHKEEYQYQVLSVADAIDKLNDERRSFLLFNEDKTKLFFILLRQEDGYQLIEPRNYLSKEKKSEIVNTLQGVDILMHYNLQELTPKSTIEVLEHHEDGVIAYNNTQSDSIAVAYKKSEGVYGIIHTMQ